MEQPPVKEQKTSSIRWGKVFLWILVLAFTGVQFVQPDKNNNSLGKDASIARLAPIPDSVEQLLQVACYDCHSNNTRYPWYTNIQPVGWWLSSHINKGKRHLNFDAFTTYPAASQQQKLTEVIESQQEGWMPLSSYTWIHKDARLTAAQRQQIIAWANAAKKAVDSSTSIPGK